MSLLLPLRRGIAHANGISLSGSNPAFENWPGQEPAADRIPEEWRIQYLKRSPDKLAADITHLFDREWQLERTNDRLTNQLKRAHEKLKAANRKIWVLSLIVGPALNILLQALWKKLH